MLRAATRPGLAAARKLFVCLSLCLSVAMFFFGWALCLRVSFVMMIDFVVRVGGERGMGVWMLHVTLCFVQHDTLFLCNMTFCFCAT